MNYALINIQNASEAYLTGVKLNVVAFVAEALRNVRSCQSISASLQDEGKSILFATKNENVSIALAYAKGKLRAICARLARIGTEQLNTGINPYGDVCTVSVEDAQGPFRVQITFANTTRRQAFTLELLDDGFSAGARKVPQPIVEAKLEHTTSSKAER